MASAADRRVRRTGVYTLEHDEGSSDGEGAAVLGPIPAQKMPMNAATDFAPRDTATVSARSDRNQEFLNAFYESDAAPGSSVPGGKQKFSVDTSGSSSRPTDSSTPSTWYQVGFYTSYFAVHADDVMCRLKNSLLPIHSLYVGCSSDQPDLYGPFWVTTTLIMATSVGSNLFLLFRSLLPHPGAQQLPEYLPINFATFGMAATVFYLYVGIMSVAVWATRKYVGLASSLASTVCLYGYSLTALIPAVVICAGPSSTLVWISLALGFAISIGFLLQNLWRDEVLSNGISLPFGDSGPNFDATPGDLEEIRSASDSSVMAKGKGVTLALSAIGVHIGLFLFMRFYFF
ncbi:Protein YIPF1-like [Porphyridium purpureum]|uniref:Protein YIPF n=1 Tax=Porphyridium purpureum TaxID=35688 RepID=A0A5J4Z3T7_PORPP|nr:Protein YIPF1-like [Porphyridium purpureum]|eukprot:POR7160..scf295_1